MIETTNKFWAEIYHQNIKKMIGICYRYTYDTQLAEDLAHDAFVLAYQKVASFEGKGPFEAWLRRIIVNVCLQHIREKSKEKYVCDFFPNETDTMDTVFETEQKNYDFSHEELLDAINWLPEHYKLVFNLYVIDKFSHAQIGVELGISEGTSKSHLARARKKLKQILIDKLKSEKVKNKRILFLFGFPLKLWNIEKLYYSRFRNIEIQNLKPFSFDSIGTNTVQIPTFKTPFLVKNLYSIVATVGAGISLVIYLNSKGNDSTPETKLTNDNKKDTVFERNHENLSKKQDSTATNSKKDIIVKESNFSPNKNDTMKKSTTVAAILLAGTTLADSKGQTIITDTASSNSNQLTLNEKSINYGQSNTENFEPISDNASGTFYATSISWSADDNKLYFDGKVIVDIEKNKFIGNGKFSVIGKVYYLVVDGKPVKLGVKVTLDETKKHKITRISADNAVMKYGDAGKQGAVEIELAVSTN